MKIDMKARTKKFTLDCAFLCSKFPSSREFNAYINQLIRCSSSVGANYRASQRAKSTADFINKLKIVEEEADEVMMDEPAAEEEYQPYEMSEDELDY